MGLMKSLNNYIREKLIINKELAGNNNNDNNNILNAKKLLNIEFNYYNGSNVGRINIDVFKNVEIMNNKHKSNRKYEFSGKSVLFGIPL